MDSNEVEMFAKAYGSCFGGATVDDVKEVLYEHSVGNHVFSDDIQIVDAWLLWNIARSS